MITFHSRQPVCDPRVRKNENSDTVNFTSQIASLICTATFTNRVKLGATIFKSRCSRTVLCYRFDTVEALPLVWTRFLRLAHSSPKTARSPARWARDGRKTSGKKSGEMTHVVSAQRPGNGRTVATAMPPNVRQDDSQDNLPCAGQGRAMFAWKLARQPATWPRNSRETFRKMTCQNPAVMFLTIPF
jgi:AraC-like DNA-binding protein